MEDSKRTKCLVYTKCVWVITDQLRVLTQAKKANTKRENSLSRKRVKRCQNGNNYAGFCFCDKCISPIAEGIERVNAKDNNGTDRVVKDLSKSQKKEWD